MPVSHLGLTVSHIPSATSFYLSALQPLGYRYIGHQGDSIGLGVESADFFLTQSPIGTRPSPNHIAFLADSRLVVRDCYAAALNSGGLPSGAPNYRNDDCSCFNAAVEDLDGNTIEFIFRQLHGEPDCCDRIAPSESQRVLTWQKDVAESADHDDALSVAKSTTSRASQASKTSKAKSRTQTALDLASDAAKSVKSDAPSQSISRSSTMPAKSDFPGKAIIGTALGAAAGAALMYALTKKESENARDEADHLAYMATKQRSRSLAPGDQMPPPPPRAETLPPSVPPASSQAPNSQSRTFHRNYSTTESAFSRRPPPQETRAMRMIEANGNNGEDDDVQEFMSRYNGMRMEPTRSRTADQIEYAPAPSRSARSQAPSGSGLRRAMTLPIEEPEPSRGGRSHAPSRHSIKRSVTMPVEQPVDRSNYYLEAAPPKSSVSRHSSRHDAVPRSPASHVSRHSHRHEDEEKLQRHDSGVSMHSHRSRRDRESDSGRRSSASTVKPYRRDSGGKHETVPAAVAAAAIPPLASSKAPSSCYFPAAISLPPSHVSAGGSRGGAASFVSAREEPLDPVASKQSWEDFEAEESDGLGDVKTVLPDDSISCVDLSRPRRRRAGHHSSRHSSRRSEASTVKPAKKVSVMMPVRERREGRKGVLGL